MAGAILFVLSLIAGAIGALVMFGAKGAIHEILAGVSLLIGAVFLSAALIVDRLDRIRAELRKPPSP